MFIKAGLPKKKSLYKTILHIPETFIVYYIEHEDRNRTKMFVYSLKEIWKILLIFLIK